MPFTRETFALNDELRLTINGEVSQAAQALAEAWVSAWDALSEAWSAAVDDVMGEIEDGRWPTSAQIARLSRVRDAMTATVGQLDRLSELTAVTITDSAGRAVNLASDWEERIIGSQFPEFGGAFDRLDADALRSIVLRTTERITAGTLPLSDEAAEAMYRALVRGVALGENPRVAAQRMLARVEGRFNGGLARALTIARTEILDAHRAAAEAHHKANADVLAGWIWKCSLSRRTCPSCLAQNGTLHPVDEPGPNDHPNGRCIRVPKAKTWKELGIDLPEPKDAPFPDARAWFDRQSRAAQLEIMGPARLDAYLRGDIGWDDMTAVRHATDWRDSYQTPPLGKITRRARSRVAA